MNRRSMSRASCTLRRAASIRFRCLPWHLFLPLVGAHFGSRFSVFYFFNFSGKKHFFAFLELIGLEPTTFAMPLQRSSQVSYSPDGFILTEN